MSTRTETPWHVWVFAIITLLWNAVGGFDYAMMRLDMSWYTGLVPDDPFHIYLNQPQWFAIVWAIFIWTSVAGSLLMLLRSRLSTLIFTISLISFGIALADMFHFHPVLEMSSQNLIICGAILAVLLIETAYSITMKQLGHLR